jgi:hypothetical protein
MAEAEFSTREVEIGRRELKFSREEAGFDMSGRRNVEFGIGEMESGR